MKKIYFDGCSYTFGQGLELYCNPIDKFEHDRMSKYNYTFEDIEFIKKNRFSGVISNYFSFEEINKSQNGKSNGEILRDLNKKDIEQYQYCIIQLTHFARYFTNNIAWTGHPDNVGYHIKHGNITQEDVNYTIQNIESIQLNYFLEIEKIFINYPNRLKIIFHSNEWEEILSQEQIKKYGISIDGEYMIRKWAAKNNMFINQQNEFKNEISTSHDTHLCIEGHKILAESIIKQL